MAKYKDTAELEYKGVDNLSNTISKINKRLEQQQDRAKRTEDRIDKYNDRLRESSAVISKSESSIKKYSDQLDKERAAHKANINIIADAVHKRDQLNQELNQARASLNNLSKEEKLNEDTVKRATEAVKRADEAYLRQQKTVLNLKDDQSKLNKSINETERAHSKAQTAQERATNTVDKMTQAVREQEVNLRKQERAIRDMNIEILEAGGRMSNLAAKVAKVSSVVEDTSNSILKFGKDLDKVDAHIDSFEASLNKMGKSSQKNDQIIDSMRNGLSKTKSAYEKYKGTLESVAAKSKKLADTTSKVGAAWLKFKTPIKTVTSSLSKSKDKTDKQSAAFNKLTSSTTKTNSKLNQTNSLLGRISKIQTIKFGIQMASGAVNSIRMFFQAGEQLSKMLVQNDNITRQYNASLGDQTKVLDDIYDKQLKYLGVSYQETQQTASRIAQQAENYNMTKEAAAGYAVMGTELASVLSVTNLKQLDMEQSSERLISALRGEAEAAELLGLNINATKMQDYTEKIKERGAAVEGSFRALDTATQADIRMMAAIEQTAVITGTAVDPIYDLASANQALNKILLETGDSLTEEQKAALKWKIAINEIKEAFRGFGVPLMNTMGTLVSSIGGLLIKLKPLISGILSALQLVADGFAIVVDGIAKKASELASKAAPYFEIFADIMERKIRPVAENIKKIFSTLSGVASTFAEAFSKIISHAFEPNGKVETFKGTVEKIFDIINRVVFKVAAATTKFAGWVTQSQIINKAMLLLYKVIHSYIIPFIGIIKDIFEDIVAVVSEFWSVLTDGSSNTNILMSAFKLLGKVISTVVETSMWLWKTISRIIDVVRNWLVESEALTFIVRIFAAVAVVAKDIIEVLIIVWEIFVDIAKIVMERFILILPIILKLGQIIGMILLPIIMLLWKAFVLIVKVVLQVINALLPLINFINMLWRIIFKITNLILSGLIWVLTRLYDIFMTLWDVVGVKIAGVFSDFLKKCSDLTDAIKTNLLPYIKDFSKFMTDYFLGPIKDAISFVQDLIDKFKLLIGQGEEASKASTNGISAGQGVYDKLSKSPKTQTQLIQSSVSAAVQHYGNLNGSSATQPTTSYSSTKNNVSFNVTGGYRKSLSNLQREAQVVARRNGVPLR